MPLLTLAAEAATESTKEMTVAEMFIPTPFGIHPLLFILMLLIVGTAVIATIITLRVRKKRTRHASSSA